MSAARRRVRVAVVGDDPLAVSALARRLSAEPDAPEAVVEVAPVEALGAVLERRAPDVLLWDLGLDPRAGIERLHALAPAAVPIVALLGDDDVAGDAWDAGARGLVGRDAAGGRLTAALRAAALGLTPLDESIAESLLRARSARPEELVEPLTARELEVLRLLAEGLSNKAVAARLGISEHTAKFHVNSILGKLGADGRTEAVVRATRLGLIAL